MSDIDGVYQVSTTTNYEGPLEKKSDGVTEIRDSQTKRFDDNGVYWHSTFSVISDDAVEMKSVADPSEAKRDFALTLPNGSPTREPVEYSSELKLARKGDKIQMSGQINYGDEIVFITMRKIKDLD